LIFKQAPLTAKGRSLIFQCASLIKQEAPLPIKGASLILQEAALVLNECPMFFKHLSVVEFWDLFFCQKLFSNPHK
jgi:hypothetical protein